MPVVVAPKVSARPPDIERAPSFDSKPSLERVTAANASRIPTAARAPSLEQTVVPETTLYDPANRLERDSSDEQKSPYPTYKDSLKPPEKQRAPAIPLQPVISVFSAAVPQSEGVSSPKASSPPKAVLQGIKSPDARSQDSKELGY